MDASGQNIDADGEGWRFPGSPVPPDWKLDFSSIERQHDWFSSLEDCPQDPHWHAEGNVGIHTRLVCQALVNSQAWRGLDSVQRSIVFAATLMHDMAKPACSREEGGRITARGHAERGARMARQAFSQLHADSLDTRLFDFRQQIVGLVRHHGLPLRSLDSTDPRRAIIRASQTTRLDWLAILARADVDGRECADRDELRGRIDLFSELAHELACFQGPFRFASDHSRVHYFANANASEFSPIYDDTQVQVIVMSGAPGAGKDRWIHSNAKGTPVVSLDAIRSELGVAPTDDQGVVLQAARQRARQLLRAKRNFVWNATNTTRVVRGRLLKLLRSYRARVRIVYLEAAFDVHVARNRERQGHVPQQAWNRIFERLEVPDQTEAHQVDYLIG